MQLKFVKIYHIVQMLKWTHTHTHTGAGKLYKNLVLFLLREEIWIKREVPMWFPIA